jgi:lipopolysaccharide/colanic/teichoic acid biosynthesis glycosyltransferase
MYRTEEIHRHSTVTFSSSWSSSAKLASKRIMDIMVSSAVMMLLSPLYLALAILVKFTSSGPVFYRWQVVGKDGRAFVGYKFRSMIADADQLKEKLGEFNEMNGPVFKMTDDPRTTPLGRWMRRYSLDELPQLYSVLRGDMSLVGPRPPLVSEYVRFTDYQKQKVVVKPGITCLWQVNGRNNVKDFDEWVKLDLEYVRCWNPMLDVKILLKTARAVLSGSGK